MSPRFLKQFAAVLIGSTLYFFVLIPHLPPSAQHTPYRLDWGLLIDLWVCLVICGLIELLLPALCRPAITPCRLSDRAISGSE
jgi:hypothetical protein